MIPAMTINELITELQALPAEQRRLEAYVYTANGFAPITRPVAVDIELSLTKTRLDFGFSRLQKRVMVVG